jgi:hypothetical protein
MYDLIGLPVKGMLVARLILVTLPGGGFQVDKSPGLKANVVVAMVSPTAPQRLLAERDEYTT